MKQKESRKERLGRLHSEVEELYQDMDVGSPQNDRLLGVPMLMPGEAFSSWCWRIQYALKISERSLLSILGLTSPAFVVDMGCVNVDWSFIAHMVMQPVNSFDSLTFSPKMFTANTELACLTTRPLSKRPIYRYCETCLRNDSVPHIRQFWRLACAYVCPRHGSILRDLCPSCHEPLALPVGNPRHLKNPTLRECPHCGSDLCNVEAGFFPTKLQYLVLARQMELVKLITNGSTLMETTAGDWTEKGFVFETTNGGVIELTSDQNAQRLCITMFASLFERLTDGESEAQSAINRNLLRVQLPMANLAIGLDGWALFGKEAGAIPGFLIGRQDLWSGTYWWSLDRADPLLKSPGYEKSDYIAAAAWVTGLSA